MSKQDKKDVASYDAIQGMIFIIRGQKVMLDKDLAVLYEIKPTRLREQVKRNIKRFPSDFMFRLNEKEIRLLVSQNAIPSRKTLGGHGLMVFTEQGVAMLSSVLNSERAVQVNIAIMRTFTKLREMLNTHKDLKDKIEKMEQKYDQQFQVVFKALKALLDEPVTKKKGIGFHVK